MADFMRLPLSIFLILLTVALSGCGKKSPLTLPEEEAKTMVQATSSDQASLQLISFQESK
jgi:predicted small lipoprotein YifL